MKKKLWKIPLTLIMTACLALGFTACDKKDNGEHTHTYIDGICSVCGEPDPDASASKGLAFDLSADGESYVLTGAGSCTDEDLIIPSRNNGKPVTAIANRAFEGNGFIKKVTIPKTVKSVGSYTFFECSALTAVNIADGLLSIGKRAFTKCNLLSSVSIPDSITKMGEEVFVGCGSLAFNEYEGGNYLGNEKNPYAVFVSAQSNEINVNKGAKILADCALMNQEFLRSITLPEGLVSIGDEAFRGCRNLNEIKIPESVTKIGKEAFFECASLAGVNIPDGVTTIEKSTFWNCSALKEVVIPDSVTSIEQSAFYGCSSLAKLNIPDGITGIGCFAFSRCNSLGYNEYANAYYLGNSKKPYLVLIKAKDVSITGCNLNATTKVIYTEAFKDCTALKSATLPKGLKEIGDGAFRKCNSLKSIEIPEGVIRIGDSAFCDCTALETVALPDSVTDISYMPFEGCSSLKFNEYSNAFYLGNEKNPHLALIQAKNTSITTCSINDNVKLISGGAFSSCDSLESVVIPDGVSVLGNRVFYDCSSLKSITLPAKLNLLGYYAIGGCTALTDIHFNGTMAQWTGIEKEFDEKFQAPVWDLSSGDYVVHCTDGDLAKNQ